uniref:Uncharacterized protein n=1 Tax=Anopheles quadriannulatus TaxID=34691 RepID=A0A182XQ83_ANOQN
MLCQSFPSRGTYVSSSKVLQKFINWQGSTQQRFIYEKMCEIRQETASTTNSRIKMGKVDENPESTPIQLR